MSKLTLFLAVMTASILLCAIPSEVKAQNICPEGYKCIPNEVAERWKAILEERQCQDEALDALEQGLETDKLKVTYEPYEVIVTQDGQVFDRDELVAHLEWCNTKIKVTAKPQLKVNIKKDAPEATPTWGFRLRVRLAVNVWPKALFTSEEVPVLEPALALEPFYLHNFHLITWAGFQTFGAGVGYDVTRNANVYVGAGGRWANAEFGPVLGVSLSFN